MVKIYSDYIVVSKDDPSYFPLSIYLKIHINGRSLVTKKRTIKVPAEDRELYNIYNDMMFIPRGLYGFVKGYFKYSNIISVEKITSISNVDSVINNISEYKDILDGITLRPEQLEAVRRALKYKRCIIQMGTGSGKSEVMCAVTKCLADVNNGIIPTVLVMEPTVRLKMEMIERFKKYDIPVVDYSQNRKIIDNYVNVCHPQSLGNDLRADESLLNNVQVLFGDEGHHMKSESWRSPTKKMKNLEYSIVVSASAIDQSRVDCVDIKKFTYGEILIMSSSGMLVYNVNADSLIDRGSLAEPVLVVLRNPADEKIENYKKNFLNWHVVSKVRLQSENRTNLIVSAAEFFHNKDRKSLILVHTRDWAHRIMMKLYDLGLSDYTRCSFGGGVFEKYNGYEFVKDDSNVMDRFGSGEFSILVGTSHLYEGIDIPNLDVLILAYGGKAERLQLQGVGRVLRKTKSGNKAYIIDFTDSEDVVLSAQSKRRMNRYENIIGIGEDDIFYDMNIEDLEFIFNKYENPDVYK